MLGTNVERTFAKVAGETAVPTSLDAPETQAGGAFSGNRSNASPVEASTPVPRGLIISLMAIVPIGTAIIGWIILRRPAKPVIKDRAVIRRETINTTILLTRLNAKREQLWQLLMSNNDLLLKKQIAVCHVMTREVITISELTPGKKIAELLAKNHVARLLVCDENKSVLGVVRESDHRVNPEALAEEIMTPLPSSIAPKSSLGSALSLLIERGLSFLPVVDRGKLCGVLTATDLVLTLHCSLDLWHRVAQTRESSLKRAEVLEKTNGLMEETADQLKSRVQRLPDEVNTVVQTGNTTGLVAEIDELTSTVSQLMQQLEDARAQIREQTSEIDGLKESSPDEATGALSREDLDRVTEQLLGGSSRTGQPLSLIFSAVGNYHSLRREEGQESADRNLRLLADCVAENIDTDDQVARYRDDSLAIVLPGTDSEAARLLCTTLTDAAIAVFGDDPACRPRMSIVSARASESASELIERAGSGLAHDPCELAESADAETVAS